MDFAELQRQVGEWSARNFPGKVADDPLHGVSEELGELTEAFAAYMEVVQAVGRLQHAFLKRKQGIRGTPEELFAKLNDAVGDLDVFLSDFCNQVGIDRQAATEEAWYEVRDRDWRKNPASGQPVPAAELDGEVT